MFKQEFLDALKLKLSCLPENDIEERINFYSEMIDDIIEEGSTEENAVLSVGSIDDIAAQIISDSSNFNSGTESESKKTKRRLKGWEIALLIIGSPLWLALGIAAISVIFSLYVVFWSLIVSCWSVFAALVGGFISGIVSGVIFMCTNSLLTGFAMIGAGLACAGFSIFAFVGCLYATKGAARLSKMVFVGIINIFREKESK